MGNSQSNPQTEPPQPAKLSPATIIKNMEKKLLISWTTQITKQWFEYHLILSQSQLTNQVSIKQLLQSYIDTLCIEYGFDGYGLSLMNEPFFIKISFNIIHEKSKLIHQISDDIITATKSMIQSLFNDHIIRIQEFFNTEYPATEIKLQNEPNIKYLEQIIASKDDNMEYKLLEWYHYQTEHRFGYASRALSRIWILQPSTCKRYYGEIQLIPLSKFNALQDINPKTGEPVENNNKKHVTDIENDELSKAILFSNVNECKPLSLHNISCFIWYSLTLSSAKDEFHNFAMPKGAFSKRCNASSGGLHPVEFYFILPSNVVFNKQNSDSGKNEWLFCHYPVRQHVLEILGCFNKQINNDDNDDEQKTDDEVINNVFYVLISAVDFREVWKYGERGLRYSLLDIGHGLSALCIIANLMGWKCQIASNISLNELKCKFKLPASDHPRILLKIECFNPLNEEKIGCNDINLLSNEWILNQNEYITEGYAALSDTWPILGIVEKHCLLTLDDDMDDNKDNEEKKNDDDNDDDDKMQKEWIDCNIDLDIKNNKDIFADYCIAPNYAFRHRRSALEFDIFKGKFAMFRDSCFMMKNIEFPFKYLCCYILYVIRIENIESGIYLLFPKHAGKYENIYKEYIEKTTQQKANVIELIHGDNDDEILKIYQYKQIDEETVAKMSKHMACHQNLCSNASFTIDFCVDLDIALKSGSNYNASHWECGYIGQLLYVHMECMGLGATAIGCYLDDYASSNVGFLPKPIKKQNNDDEDEEDDIDPKIQITPNDLKRFDDFDHPLKNIRSLCHFSCGTPSKDLRYPYYAWEYNLFPFDQ